MKVHLVQPIFAPTKEQAERNIRSLQSLSDYVSAFPQEISLDFAGWGLPPYISWIAARIHASFAAYDVAVEVLDRNYGKAYVVNRMLSKERGNSKEFLLLCDSDIVFDRGCENMLDRLLEILEVTADGMGKPFGLIALNQLEGNCHLDEARVNLYSFTNSYGNRERVYQPRSPSGIAGGCLFCSREAWQTVGGYREMGVYAGDDAFLLLDMAEKGFSYQLSEDVYVIHPPDQNREYGEWKKRVCLRDSDGARKPSLSAQIDEAESFWKSSVT